MYLNCILMYEKFSASFFSHLRKEANWIVFILFGDKAIIRRHTKKLAKNHSEVAAFEINLFFFANLYMYTYW